ncbi:hypothetical protein BTVI_71817 [Pitangus sulphuratus]|nr:hypothetical protein BTVI_71817 [Pitangus sulphuratus]
MAVGHEDQRATGETGFLEGSSDDGERQVQSCPKSPHVTIFPKFTSACLACRALKSPYYFWDNGHWIEDALKGATLFCPERCAGGLDVKDAMEEEKSGLGEVLKFPEPFSCFEMKEERTRSEMKSTGDGKG